MKALLDAKIAAMRTPCLVYPRPLIRANRLDDQSAVVYPFTDRVSEPARIGVFRKFPPVSPDHPPDFVELIQHHDFLRRLHNLCLSEFLNVLPPHSFCIAKQNRPPETS